MKEQILKILDEGKKYGYSNEAVAGELLGLFGVSKRTTCPKIKTRKVTPQNCACDMRNEYVC